MGVYISSPLPREDNTCSKATFRQCSCRCVAGLTTSLRRKSSPVCLSGPDYWWAPLQPFLLCCLRQNWKRILIVFPSPGSLVVCSKIRLHVTEQAVVNVKLSCERVWNLLLSFCSYLTSHLIPISHIFCFFDSFIFSYFHLLLFSPFHQSTFAYSWLF